MSWERGDLERTRENWGPTLDHHHSHKVVTCSLTLQEVNKEGEVLVFTITNYKLQMAGVMLRSVPQPDNWSGESQPHLTSTYFLCKCCPINRIFIESKLMSGVTFCLKIPGLIYALKRRFSILVIPIYSQSLLRFATGL